MSENKVEGSSIPTQELKVGDTFELKKGEEILIGRFDPKSALNTEMNVFGIPDLKDADTISRLALSIGYDGRAITVGHVDRILDDGKGNLTDYKSKNKIMIEKTRSFFEELPEDSKFISRNGAGILGIAVYDENQKNGFILETVGNNRFKLVGVLVNEIKLKA